MSRTISQNRRSAAFAAPLALAVVLAAGVLTAPSARAAQDAVVPAAGTAEPPAHGETLAAREIGSDAEAVGPGRFSPDQLAAFAAAVTAVREVDRTWHGRIDWAHSPEEAEARTAQAAEEMVAAIEAQGLSVVEYNAITQAIAKNRRLHAHVAGLLVQEQSLAAR